MLPNTPLSKEHMDEASKSLSEEYGEALKKIEDLEPFIELANDLSVMAKAGRINDMRRLLVVFTVADRDAAIREAQLKTEIRIHDEYWHSQRLVAENGIGPVALANKEATELDLRNLQSQPNAKEEE